MKKATNLKELWQYCDPFKALPTEGEEAEWFVDCSKVRKSHIAHRIKRSLNFVSKDQFIRFGIVGSFGSGKTTEINKAEQELRKDYVVVPIKADDFFDINSDAGVRYTDIFWLIGARVEAYFRETLKRPLDNNLLEKFADWFKEIVNTTIKEVDAGYKLNAEIGLGGDLPFFAKLLATVSGWVQNSMTKKQEIRERTDSVFGQLYPAINLLLKDAQSKIKDKKGLIILIDEFDKPNAKSANDLFIEHGQQLQKIEAHLITTMPSSVIYGSGQNIQHTFGPYLTIPMIRTHDPENNDDTAGLKILSDILARRCNPNLVFSSVDLTKKFAKFSGGSIREMFRLVREACQFAEGDKIDDKALGDAIDNMKQDFERRLVTLPYSTLLNIYNDKNLQSITDLDILNKFLGATAILEYNGDQFWHDVHPIVQETQGFKNLIKS